MISGRPLLDSTAEVTRDGSSREGLLARSTSSEGVMGSGERLLSNGSVSSFGEVRADDEAGPLLVSTAGSS